MSTNPSKEHLNRALYICHYLIGTWDYSLIHDGASDKGLIACTDSDWGQDKVTYHSQTGFYLKLTNGVFLWNSDLQKTTALSSMEAEYMTLSHCTHQAIWIHQMMEELGWNLGPILICDNNHGLLFITQNLVTKKRPKHITIQYHFVHNTVMLWKQVELLYTPGTDNPVDTYIHMFTKNFGHVKFNEFRSQLRLEFHSTWVSLLLGCADMLMFTMIY